MAHGPAQVFLLGHLLDITGPRRDERRLGDCATRLCSREIASLSTRGWRFGHVRSLEGSGGRRPALPKRFRLGQTEEMTYSRQRLPLEAKDVKPQPLGCKATNDVGGFLGPLAAADAPETDDWEPGEIVTSRGVQPLGGLEARVPRGQALEGSRSCGQSGLDARAPSGRSASG